MSISDFAKRLRLLPLALGMAAILLGSIVPPAKAAGAKPMEFASPQQAVDALIAAARADEAKDLLKIFGSAGRKLVHSGDAVADREGRARFVARYESGNKIVQEGEDKAILEIGPDQWPFPIPMIRQGNAWHFNTKAGEEEILNRRIGRNELNAIEVCRAYVEAQRDFAALRVHHNEIIAYAQKFRSSRGKRDGLYWPAKLGDDPSPLGPLMADARGEGYRSGFGGEKRSPYHGYYYKILTRQGKDAPGGAYDYIAHGEMIGGFALVAFPAAYGDSGVMTFIVNQDGIVHQKNLGPDTAKIARAMTEYNPDQTWTKP